MLLYYWKDTTHPPPFPSFFFSCENSKTTKKQCGTKNTIAMGRFGRIRAQDNYWRDGVKQDKVFVKISETFNKPSAKSCYKWWWIYVAKYQWFGAKKKTQRRSINSKIGEMVLRTWATVKWYLTKTKNRRHNIIVVILDPISKKSTAGRLRWSLSFSWSFSRIPTEHESSDGKTGTSQDLYLPKLRTKKKKTGESNLTKKNLNFTCPR